jgi:hypothetical protein
VIPAAGKEEQPEQANRGLKAKPLRSVYTVVVVLGLLLLLAVGLLSGRGEECTTVAAADGDLEQVCFGQFPDSVGDFFR